MLFVAAFLVALVAAGPIPSSTTPVTPNREDPNESRYRFFDALLEESAAQRDTKRIFPDDVVELLASLGVPATTEGRVVVGNLVYRFYGLRCVDGKEVRHEAFLVRSDGLRTSARGVTYKLAMSRAAERMLHPVAPANK